MQRIPVESSDIVAVGYDPKTRLLEVEFRGNRIYQYKQVEPDIYEQFMKAESHGRFFSSYIDRHYRYERVEAVEHTVQYPEVLAFVTNNERKYRDLQKAFEPYGIAVEQVKVATDEVQSSDAQEIAIKKAKHAYKLARRPVVVSDVFWNILSLRGFPGAYMNEVTRWLTTDDWLRLLEGKPDRTVYATDTVAYYDGKRAKAFTQHFTGNLAEEARGSVGESIDKLLILEGQTKTVAEMEEQTGMSSFDISTSNLADFAKWFNLQRRLGKG